MGLPRPRKRPSKTNSAAPGGKLTARDYKRELARLHVELVEVQQWVVHTEQQDKSDLGTNSMIALQSAATNDAILSHSISALLKARNRAGSRGGSARPAIAVPEGVQTTRLCSR